MTVPSSLDIRVFLKKYQTVNYYTAVRDSVVKDLQGKVYHIINSSILQSKPLKRI